SSESAGWWNRLKHRKRNPKDMRPRERQAVSLPKNSLVSSIADSSNNTAFSNASLSNATLSNTSLSLNNASLSSTSHSNVSSAPPFPSPPPRPPPLDAAAALEIILREELIPSPPSPPPASPPLASPHTPLPSTSASPPTIVPVKRFLAPSTLKPPQRLPPGVMWCSAYGWCLKYPPGSIHSVQDKEAMTKHGPSSEIIEIIGAEGGAAAKPPVIDWLKKISEINIDGFEQGVIGMQMRESEALVALNRLDETSKTTLAEYLPQNLGNNDY
ncbi:hypothetical protein CYMTET_17143, partial [Cymbomonas tetramitiformis]